MRHAFRSDLRPGEIFVVEFMAWDGRRRIGPLVVLDAKTEVDFFHGGMFAVGDVAPSELVEVIS